MRSECPVTLQSIVVTDDLCTSDFQPHLTASMRPLYHSTKYLFYLFFRYTFTCGIRALQFPTYSPIHVYTGFQGKLILREIQ
jgi:hypothetical protein